MKASSLRPLPRGLHPITDSELSNPIRHCPYFNNIHCLPFFTLLRFMLAFSSLTLLFPKITNLKETDLDSKKNRLALVAKQKEKKL